MVVANFVYSFLLESSCQLNLYQPKLFRINQYNATNDGQSTGKSQMVAELGPAQPQLVFFLKSFSDHKLLIQVSKIFGTGDNCHGNIWPRDDFAYIWVGGCWVGGGCIKSRPVF